MAPPGVNAFYRIWFTVVDPFVLFFTVIACIVAPANILETVLPPSIEQYSSISHGPLLFQSAALYGFMMIIFGWLLRTSSDLNVWRIVQWATLGVDCGLLVTMYVALVQQDRLAVDKMVSGDFFNIGFTVWVALIRIAFLMGNGAPSAQKKMR